ncbi:PKD domain-containing protein [Chitinophaga filiformis]|uniref:PKD domain-containing protein n=1 Tax=Chitinophaga filiformis TaxID=104663 RepID=A0ABY4HUF4_CHIFI|nr:PKD domain-containing protein [Chitinophaga filiformis]UPK67093.1 PKD domain-containing protein [Chitinophaga filiformis]
MKHLYTTMVRLFTVCLAVGLYPTLAATAQMTAVSLAGTNVTNSGGYYEYVPPSYAGSKESFPLLIFIHGIGELGNGTTQLPAVLRNGIPKLITNGTFPASFTVQGKSYSFIVVAPQFKKIPAPVDVLSLVNYLKKKYRIDNKRIYVTGLSMGGGVTEDFASAGDAYAKIVAAAVPIAGNMNPRQLPSAPNNVAKYDVPMWFLHNEDDPMVPSQYSKDWVSMIDAYKPAPNPQPKLTIFDAKGHDAWSRAYDPAYKENGMNVYEWMLQYEQGKPVSSPPPPPPPGNKKVMAKPNIGNGMYYTDAMSAFKLNPGDTLCIPAGDYEFIQLGNLVGTAAKPIVITNCGGVVRTGIKTLKTDVSFGIMGGKFLHITGSGTPGIEYGFDVNGKNLIGVKMQGMYLGSGSSDIDVHNFYIHDVGSFIVAKTTQECDNPQFWEGRYVMKNVKIHHIKGRYAAYEGFYIGNTHYIMDYLLCKGIKSHHIQDLEVYDNDLQYMGQDGIQVAMADMGDNRVHNNVVRNYGTNKLDAQSYGMLMGGGSRVKLYDNVVDDGYLPGIALFGSGISYVYNNTVSNVENGEGIQVADKLILEPVTAYIYNNTIYNTGNSGIKIYAYLTTIGHKVYNNLIIEKSLGGSYPTDGIYIRGAQNIKFDYGNNLFSTIANAASVVTNGAGGDLHLTAKSKAIDAGKSVADLGLADDLDGNRRPMNKGFDVGAYEYQGPASPGQGNNSTPVANAGKDITITLPTNTVTLDASASTDADGKISKYAWKQLSGPNNAAITNAAIATTSVTGLAAGTYIFTLTITDDKAATDVDSITVKVNPAVANKAPVANAGANTTITLPVNSVALDGSASKDADGKITKYAWKKLSGPVAGTLSAATLAKTTVTGLVAGTYVFSLTVTDDDNATATANVTVTVNPVVQPNKAPVANAGANTTITLPVNSVALDGSASKDADGKITKYAWKKLSGPVAGTLSAATLAKTTVTGLVAGTYVFSLTVTDDDNATATANVTVTVNPVVQPNKAPVANAGANTTITLPVNSVALDGSASKDADGKITKYAWKKLSGPVAGTLSAATLAKTTVTGLVAGTYVFSLTVTDDDNATATANVTVTVNPVAQPNKAPVADAGGMQSITLPVNTVTLDGSGSKDPDGKIVKYAWKKISGPAAGGIVTNASNARTTVTGFVGGTYTFSLTVTDDDKATSTANVVVRVNNQPPDIAPVANAGPDQTITLPNNAVELDGSGSKDADGRIMKYAWRKLSGPSGGTFTQSNVAVTRATDLVEGTYVLTLTVADDDNVLDTDTMRVVVKPAPVSNRAPVANAGADVTITLPVNSVILNAAASSDADGVITNYQWLKVAGKDVRFSNSQGIINVVSALTEGTYTFELTVTDNKNATAKDRITVRVLPAKTDDNNSNDKAPVARTQGDLTLKLPVQSMNADGNASYAINSTITSYAWKQVYGPLQAIFSAPNASSTKISGMAFPGSYVFELTVTDANNLSSRSTFEVTVLDTEGDAFVPEVMTYPNPAVSTLYFKQRMKNATQGTITIFNISGRAMKSYILPAGDNQQEALDISSLPAGTYILQVVYKDSTYKWSTKFIKAN